MPVVISVEHLSKAYRLEQVSTGSTRRIGTPSRADALAGRTAGRFRHTQPNAFTNDLKVRWAKMCGKPNPLLHIGENLRHLRIDMAIRAFTNKVYYLLEIPFKKIPRLQDRDPLIAGNVKQMFIPADDNFALARQRTCQKFIIIRIIADRVGKRRCRK